MRIMIGNLHIFVDKKSSDCCKLEIANSQSRKKIGTLTLEEKAPGVFISTNHQFFERSESDILHLLELLQEKENNRGNQENHTT